MAKRSRRLEGNVHELGWSLAVFKALGNHSKSERLDTRYGLITIGTVAHHTCEIRDLGKPSAVILAFEFNRKGHVATVAFARLPI